MSGWSYECPCGWNRTYSGVDMLRESVAVHEEWHADEVERLRRRRLREKKRYESVSEQVKKGKSA